MSHSTSEEICKRKLLAILKQGSKDLEAVFEKAERDYAIDPDNSDSSFSFLFNSYGEITINDPIRRVELSFLNVSIEDGELNEDNKMADFIKDLLESLPQLIQALESSLKKEGETK